MSFSCIHYGVRYIPKSIFPSVTSQAYFFQVATSQMCHFPSRNFLKVRLGPLMRRRLQWGPSAAARPPEQKGAMAAARTDLGSCRLGNCTFGKLPLGENPLWKYSPVSNFITCIHYSPELKVETKLILRDRFDPARGIKESNANRSCPT